MNNSTIDVSVCGNLTDDYIKVWKQFEFWCEGILFSLFGLFGLLSNLTSVITLTSKEMRKHTFNQLLAVLTFCEMLYIVFNVPVHAYATTDVVNEMFTNSIFLSQVYVYILYPMSAVSFCASIYMTLAITIERYIAVCRPHQYRNISQTMSNFKRVVIYVGPVTLMSFALNIPKFMEVTFNHTNGTNDIDLTERRRHPTYIFWYTLSQIWHPTLTTGILPFICLAYMNTKIFYEIRRNRSILSGRQSKKRQSECTLGITLVSIVLMHLVCNALRVFLGVMVVVLVDVQVTCMRIVHQYIPPMWIMCLESVAHLLVMINFSTNFLIYCSVSKQFKSVLSRICFLCCPSAAPLSDQNPQITISQISSELEPNNTRMPTRTFQISSSTLALELKELSHSQAESEDLLKQNGSH